jgi:hypothetical protein
LARSQLLRAGVSARQIEWRLRRGQLTQLHRGRHGMALTSPPRTILDCAALLTDPYELERLVAEATYRRRASEAELRDQLAATRRSAAYVPSVPSSICPAVRAGPARRAERALLRLFRVRSRQRESR